MKKYEYLGKRRIYNMIKDVVKDIPACKNLVYEKYQGVEWLKNNRVHVTSQQKGCWIEVVHYAFDELTMSEEQINELFIGLDEGRIIRHFINGKLVEGSY